LHFIQFYQNLEVQDKIPSKPDEDMNVEIEADKLVNNPENNEEQDKEKTPNSEKEESESDNESDSSYDYGSEQVEFADESVDDENLVSESEGTESEASEEDEMADHIASDIEFNYSKNLKKVLIRENFKLLKKIV
jgi:hypothetical protein